MNLCTVGLFGGILFFVYLVFFDRWVESRFGSTVSDVALTVFVALPVVPAVLLAAEVIATAIGSFL